MKLLNEILGTKYPIIQGGMANIATGEFAAACSNAGALGLIGAGGMNPETLRENIRQCRRLTDKPFGVNIMLMHPQADEFAQIVIDEGVKIVTTGAGNPGKYMAAWKAAGITVIPVVAAAVLARHLAPLGIDAVIAEGTESGGHVGEMTTMALVPQVVDAVDLPVIAAGGIADGRGLAAALALDKSDFSLFKAGSSYQLKATVSGVDAPKVTWTSSDETVAAVSQDGTVTAVARGTATITAAVEGTELRASCTVRCKLPEDQPVSGGGNSSSQGSGNGGSSSQAPAADQADLSAFYTQLSGDYEFPSFMQQADQELMDIFYPGLSAVSSQQMLVYVNQMSMNMGELALIEVTDSKDVDGVKAILQARIDGMINGGAWYPETTALWEKAEICVSGNYLMLVSHENAADIAASFYALFA